MSDALLIESQGALTLATLNRPQQMNALNDEMRAKLAATLPEVAGNSEIYALMIRSATERAFCAGGDVKELTRLAASDPAAACASVAQEYATNWALECFTKPTVSLIDGVVMGSGVGIVLYGTHRVAGAGFSFAMPETGIGLFPDVGVCYALARMGGHAGRYIGLTGRAVGRASALRLGLVTHCIDASKFDAIRAGLADAEPIDGLLDPMHEAPGEAHFGANDDIIRYGGLIDETFGASSLAGIFAALAGRAEGGGEEGEWCRRVLADLKARAPLSLEVTFRHLEACKALNLREVLEADYKLAQKFLADRDFFEGVRALLIDKDGPPKWRHATIADVAESDIEPYFSGVGADKLMLPSRAAMQERRG